jgi:hypothetical protein
MSIGGLTAALAGLGVPPVVWIILLVISALLGVVAIARWWDERAVEESPSPSPPATQPRQWSPPVTSPQRGQIKDVMADAERTRRAVLPLISRKPPPVARGPENQPSPASSEDLANVRPSPQPSGRRDSLRAERDQGVRLLAALRDPNSAVRAYGRVVNWQDADSWEVNVRTLLKGSEEKLFDYEPLREQPQEGLLQALAASLGNDAAIERMEQRLGQLDKIIQR